MSNVILDRDIVDTLDNSSANKPLSARQGKVLLQLISNNKAVKGEKGDTGAQGPQGPRGPQGPQGPQGPSGDVTNIPTISTYDINQL